MLAPKLAPRHNLVPRAFWVFFKMAGHREPWGRGCTWTCHSGYARFTLLVMTPLRWWRASVRWLADFLHVTNGTEPWKTRLFDNLRHSSETSKSGWYLSCVFYLLSSVWASGELLGGKKKKWARRKSSFPEIPACPPFSSQVFPDVPRMVGNAGYETKKKILVDVWHVFTKSCKCKVTRWSVLKLDEHCALIRTGMTPPGLPQFFLGMKSRLEVVLRTMLHELGFWRNYVALYSVQ